MGLFGLFKKKKRTNSAGEDIDRLTTDGKLPFGWMVYNKDIVNQMDEEVETFIEEIRRAKDPLKKYAAIKSYLLYLEDGKKHYYKINECAGKFFEEYICQSQTTTEYKKQFNKLHAMLK